MNIPSVPVGQLDQRIETLSETERGLRPRTSFIESSSISLGEV